jgi:hypothetical protein
MPISSNSLLPYFLDTPTSSSRIRANKRFTKLHLIVSHSSLPNFTDRALTTGKTQHLAVSPSLEQISPKSSTDTGADGAIYQSFLVFQNPGMIMGLSVGYGDCLREEQVKANELSTST